MGLPIQDIQKLAQDIHLATDGWGTDIRALEKYAHKTAKGQCLEALNQELSHYKTGGGIDFTYSGGMTFQEIIRGEVGFAADANRMIDIIQTGKDQYRYNGFQKLAASFVHSVDATEINFWKKMVMGGIGGLALTGGMATLAVPLAAVCGTAITFSAAMSAVGLLLLTGGIAFEGTCFSLSLVTASFCLSPEERMETLGNAGENLGNIALMLLPAGFLLRSRLIQMRHEALYRNLPPVRIEWTLQKLKSPSDGTTGRSFTNSEIPILEAILRDGKQDASIRANAAHYLSQMGEAGMTSLTQFLRIDKIHSGALLYVLRLFERIGDIKTLDFSTKARILTAVNNVKNNSNAEVRNLASQVLAHLEQANREI